MSFQSELQRLQEEIEGEVKNYNDLEKKLQEFFKFEIWFSNKNECVL